MTESTQSPPRTNVYEGMFLFPQSASADLAGAVDHLKSILARSEAEVISLVKWDERRLAYDIKGNKRGIYFLAYFRAAGAAIARIERDCNLSEQLLRAMVLRAEHVAPEIMENAEGQQKLVDELKLRSEEAAAKEAEPAAPEESADAEGSTEA
jgi:small subunit ribosomal protein S6